MAIWQFRLVFIPETVLLGRYGSVPVSIPQELAENLNWWADVQPSAAFEAQIDVILPKASSWSESMGIWGDERGDTAWVCYNDSSRKVEEIGFRVDVRELSPAFVERICGLARDLKCMLLTGSYHLIAPEDQAVLTAINHSTAMSYLNDPVSTLRSLKPTKGEIVQFPDKTKENDIPPKDSK